MASLYKQSDIIINTSLSEGQSSALLEAMFLGIPCCKEIMVAIKVLLNTVKMKFYDDVNDFLIYAKELLQNKERREFISNAGKIM
ncbi:hypothetical protein KHA80_20655 [Anaerobacillus sp. HL2]|nr:hypothetical protein KHA80_20655 [Anaerobacillus sp. HL2]